MHTLKNIYNNFQKRVHFTFPDMDSGEWRKANFEDIKAMYDKESEMCLRMAHKLNSTVFDPTNIQRSSARMATSVFSDSTVHAKEYYSRTHLAWTGTFCFLKLVTEMWKIIIM